MFRKRCFVLVLALVLLVAVCAGCEEQSLHTNPSETESKYIHLSEKQLLQMLIECDCKTLQKLAFTSFGKMCTVQGIVSLSEECDILAEFLLRPNAIRVLRESGPDVYIEGCNSQDEDVRQNAMGFGIILQVFCPDVFESLPTS